MPGIEPHLLLYRMALRFLADRPGLPHELERDDERGAAWLTIRKADAAGFDVTLRLDRRYLSLETDLGFLHGREIGSEPKVPLERAFDFFEALLGERTRLVERSSDGRPYAWTVEVWNGKRWVTELTRRRSFYNYFGRRTERVLQNHQFPLAG